MIPAANKAYAIMLPFMAKKILIINGVAFRRIETDIGKRKRVARRIPRPLFARQLGVNYFISTKVWIRIERSSY